MIVRNLIHVRQSIILSAKTTLCPQKQPLVRQNLNVNIKTKFVEVMLKKLGA
jgi:hypothetical protein